MKSNKKKYRYFAANFLLFALLYFLHYSFAGFLAIRNVAPLLLLPMLTCFCMFNDELPCALTGLSIGICIDCEVGGAYCFHALVLLLMGAAASLVAKYLFNRNLRSAVLLSLLGNLIFFLLRWLRFYAFGETLSGSLTYLLQFAVPSAVYSAVFAIPFFYLHKFFYKRKV